VYRLLYWTALNVLPVQASAVPCKRVFSSSKETNSLHRSSLSPVTMEILQLLKFMFRTDRLTLTEGLVCTEEELSVIDIPAAAVEELLSSGKISELMVLIDSSYEGWGRSVSVEH
ncbi:hypothetical protein B0H10DRAFT_1810310, partial [Mycena sp. CBHHK59/15]